MLQRARAPGARRRARRARPASPVGRRSAKSFPANGNGGLSGRSPLLADADRRQPPRADDRVFGGRGDSERAQQGRRSCTGCPGMSATVTATQVIEDPARVAEVDPAGLPALLAQLTTAAAVVAARLSTIEPPSEPRAASGADRLLTAKEAAVLLNLSTDFLYKHDAAKPFRVRIGSDVRFSLLGIQRFIERHRGR